MSTVMVAQCAAKCPPHAIVVVVVALVVGFIIGRLTKGGKADGKKQSGEGGKKKAADRKVAPRPEPARQPIPAGSVEIYVGNLSYDMKEDELRELFVEFGEVSSARIVTNRFNGKSKGFGFVVMPNRAEAEKAIAAYSEKEHLGRRMRVNEAKNTIVTD